MKAKNFRIGNLYIDIDDKLCEMSGYELWQMSVKENNENLGINEYKPIYLTEDWLIKLGMEIPITDDPIFEHGKCKYDDPFNHFRKTSQSLTDATFEIGGVDFYADSTGFWMPIFDEYTELKYVHQFQNLFFAITGNELTVKHEVSV